MEKHFSFLFFQCFCVVFCCSLHVVYAQGFVVPDNEGITVTLPVVWKVVADSERVSVMRMLSGQFIGNGEKFRDVNATFSVVYEQGIGTDFAKLIGVPASRLSDEIVQQVDFKYNFVADFDTGEFFRERRILRQEFRGNGSSITLPNIGILNTRSVVSKNDYIHSVTDELLPTIPELPSYPNTENKRVAWREPVENAEKQTAFELIDPCVYAKSLMIWGNITVAIDALEGKHGLETQQAVSQMCRVFESQDDDGLRWYRVCRQFFGGNQTQGGIEVNILRYEGVDFLPVFHMITDESGCIRNLIQVQWKKQDALWFPVESYSVVYEKPSVLSFRRRITVQTLLVNQGVKSEYFSFSALGLANDDVLVDRIKRGIYTIQNDKPVFLAKFYEKYQTPKERAISRFRLVLMGTGTALIAWGLLSRYLRKRKGKNSK